MLKRQKQSSVGPAGERALFGVDLGSMSLMTWLILHSDLNFNCRKFIPKSSYYHMKDFGLPSERADVFLLSFIVSFIWSTRQMPDSCDLEERFETPTAGLQSNKLSMLDLLVSNETSRPARTGLLCVLITRAKQFRASLPWNKLSVDVWICSNCP